MLILAGRVQFAIYQRQGLFRSNLKLGVAYVPIEALLTKCETHQCVPLLNPENERKAVGGKIDVVVRLNQPLEKPEVEENKHTWVVIMVRGTHQ